MDVQGLVSELGVPIATSLAMMWGCFYLIKYITGNLTEMLLTRFDELRLIIIKLIDKQKEMEIKLSEWSSNTDTLVKFFQEEKDKEKERILSRHKNKK
jgi:hypothetical protein